MKIFETPEIEIKMLMLEDAITVSTTPDLPGSGGVTENGGLILPWLPLD